MRKYLLLSLLIFIASNSIQAQQKSVITQYNYNGLLLNPAYAGNQNRLTVNMLFRKQWVNFDGAPSTKVFSAHTATRNKRVGLGFLLSNDQIGVHDDIGFYGMYAYKIPFGRGNLAFGIQGGFNYLNSGFDRLNLRQNNDVVFSTFNQKFNPNVGTGLFYSTKRSYLGLSVPYLLENSIIRNGSGLSDAKESRYYFLTGGKVMKLQDNLMFKPSTLIRYQVGSPVGFDLNANFFIDDILNVGVSYRSSDAISAMFAINLNSNAIFGYAYDHTLSDIGGYSNGSHEFMLIYHINLFNELCHAYF
ncbi:type IX secretion system membrane protein PorP/SprF [Fulvivirga sp. RKSG066]|uniref:PorP/SprF family type IX secretion system membrane protein n=1 Tax=Fulvivirga aurantia TaxID=2529383 RepID=UPI0012BC43EC|nr:type IX secretion system membrane protein PorP/SprF [Fulvivirga aurantia]MTI21206.1 type IX secretion system membrane protein PorP/SprF [Fulvivirga aurantia]